MKAEQTVSLSGCRVLVTRPAAQARQLCELIEQAGGTAIPYPVINIVPVTHIDNVENFINFDMAIFISANAVQATMALLSGRADLPREIIAIGQSTANMLETYHCDIDVLPEHAWNSESLLSTVEMNAVEGKSIIIFRGVGGREYLADTLRSRGAKVEYCEVYRRELPDADRAMLLSYLQQHKIDIVTLTSNEGLHNLCTLAGNAGGVYLKKIPMVVLSERIQQEARKMQITSTINIAENASDAAMLAAIYCLIKQMCTGAHDE